MRRINNDMYRQIEELTIENERLQAKNKQLCEENRAEVMDSKKSQITAKKATENKVVKKGIKAHA